MSKTNQNPDNIEINGDVEYLVCPFCKEPDFDATGLKLHLENGWCDKYNQTSTSIPRTHLSPNEKS